MVWNDMNNVYEIPKLDLSLPYSLRSSLQKPMGTFYKLNDTEEKPEIRVISNLKTKKNSLVFVVGDIVTKSLLENNFIPDLVIIDYRSQRESKINISLPPNTLITVINPPGIITSKSWHQLRELLNYYKNSEIKDLSMLRPPQRPLNVIQVDGEEDLLVLPLILEAPIGTDVLYGQPPMVHDGAEGIVQVSVTNSLKRQVSQLLKRFNEI